jgi:thioredoxin reductase (NADPH)
MASTSPISNPATPGPSIPSALDPRTQAFPVLTEAQINRIRPFGEVRRLERGELLFQPGDTNVPFFVVLSGHMEIVQPSLYGESPVAEHDAGEFTGELTMISGRRCLVTGRVTEPGNFVEVSGEGLRALIGRDAELSEIFMRAFILRRLELLRRGQGNLVLMGSRHSAKTLALREFLSRNAQPYSYLDLDTDENSQEILDRFAVKLEEVPVVVCANTGNVLRNPTIQKLADCIGLNVSIDQSQVRDVIIVGAGPAGLAAAVYAASEGLETLVVEGNVTGGQAGSSSKIENYLGFPTGVSGQELTNRAITQAEKFGAKLMLARGVAKLDCAGTPYKVVLDDGAELAARTIVISTGAQYKKPRIANLERFEGQGIYYGATYMEAQLCGGEDVIVVGGGNSAGQAAVYLSATSRKVYMLVRSGRLSDTMSRYLIQRIEENPAIEIHYKTEIVGLEGDEHLERVIWRDPAAGTSTHDIRHVFIMAGASPRTEWLKGCLALDNKGFIVTGRDLDMLTEAPMWPSTRPPQMLETSLPGVFAVGDVRSGSVKRVASAVGEGAIAISLVHRTIAELL